MKDVVIQVKGLSKSFRDGIFQKKKTVLHDLHFQVKSGCATGFVGINGSGKTTTLKCLLEFIYPAPGARIGYFEKEQPLEQIRDRIGFLPERPYYYEFLTAEQFLRFHWDLSGGEGDFEQRLNECLELVRLKEAANQKLKTFSKGMLQRIGIAQAILRSPDLLIFDEPMSGLDPDGRLLVKDIMKEELKRGASVFFSSHLLSDIQELCEEIIVIHQGRIRFNGPLKLFLESHGVSSGASSMRVSNMNSSNLEESFRQFLLKIETKQQDGNC